jgi:proton-translocating NADH-quinone oxidoreductase chain M
MLETFQFLIQDHLIRFLISLPIAGSLLVLILPEVWARSTGLLFSWSTFLLSLLLWVGFDKDTAQFQYLETFDWITGAHNLKMCFGVDGISLFFILLTTRLIPLCLLASWEAIRVNVREYTIAFLMMEAMLILVFTVLDVVVFYIFFESVLIPMFLIVGVWGSRARKIRAAYMFFRYTLVGSVLMLLAILRIYFEAGTTDYQALLTTEFSFDRQRILWLAFFASFATKVPMVPVHIWLPEAHVEAPTAGSVILAGVLLKLGTYGLVRFSLPLFPAATVYFTPFVYTMCVLAVVYTSLTAIRQTDMKRIIAYASVAHMNVTLIGVFSLTVPGVEGGIYQMLSHGIVSSALFLCVGVLYDRHHTRLLKYYGGVAHAMPMYVTLFLVFTMANIARPGTSSFVGEFLILLGAFNVNTAAAFGGATGMVLGGGYALWLYNRVAYGNVKTQFMGAFDDLNHREWAVLLPLALITVYGGIYPEPFRSAMHESVQHLIVTVHAGS